MVEIYQVESLLMDIELELRSSGLWERQSPPRSALASEQPFCFDTLALNQWLQFIFLPRMRSLIEAGSELPGNCGIAPMAEEYYRGSDLPVSGLIEALRAIDSLLSE